MNRRMLVLDAEYSLSTIRRLGVERGVTTRDLDGFFEHVWSVNPLGGANETYDRGIAGPIRETALAPRHTFLEAPVQRFNLPRSLSPINFAMAQAGMVVKLFRLIRIQGIGVVRAGDPYYLGVLGLTLARATGARLLIRVNGDHDAIYAATGEIAYPRLLRYRWLEERIARFVFPRAEGVLLLNDDHTSFPLAHGVDPERMAVCGLSRVIADVHLAAPEDRPAVTNIDLTNRRFVVCLSRLEAIKHPSDILRVLDHVRREEPELVAMFVGDGSEKEALVRLSSELGLGDRVRFVGLREQEWIARLLPKASAVLVTQAGQRGILEATLSGVPVIAYDVDWHPDLLGDGAGFLVPYRDTRAMARALREVLRNPKAAGAVGAKGREKALGITDPERSLCNERSIYERSLDPGSDSRGSAAV